MQTQQQDASLSALIDSAIKDGQALVKQQIELTKTELNESAKQAGATFGMFVGAGVFAFLAFVFLLVAAGYGLVKAGLDEWAAFLVVALVLILIAAILGLLGRSRAKKIGPPERSKRELELTKGALAGRGGSTTP